MNTKQLRNLKVQRNHIDAKLAMMKATGKTRVRTGMVFTSDRGEERIVTDVVSETLAGPGRYIGYVKNHTRHFCSENNFLRSSKVKAVKLISL
jgi:hypothetical protein